MPSVEKFAVYCTKMPDDAAPWALAELLGKSTTLKRLSVGYSDLSEKGVRIIIDGLRRNSALQCLDISANRICDQTAALLVEALVNGSCRAMRKLDLASCKLSEESLCALATSGMPRFTKLDLSHNKIGPRAAAAIGELLERHETLQELCIWQAQLDDDTAPLILHGATHCRSLASLNIGLNGLGMRSATSIAELCKRNASVKHLTVSFAGDRIRCKDVVLDAALASTTVHKISAEFYNHDRRKVDERIDAATAANRTLDRVFTKDTPALGDGQQEGGAGDLAALPNELLTQIAARVWPTSALLRVGWTCRLMRACALNNYAAYLRWGPGYGDWRQHAKHVLLEKHGDFPWT